LQIRSSTNAVSGNEIDARKLTKDAETLENDVRKAVGSDNYHWEGPPISKKVFKWIMKPPKGLKELIDIWF
jgi:hypothetical protein